MKFYRKLSTFLCLIFLVSSVNFNIYSYASDTVGEGENNTAPPLSSGSDSLDLNAQTAVLIDAKSGIVIYDKNKDQQMYPASITKILTTLIALENIENFSQKITFSHEAVFSIPVGAKHIAMNEDETLTYNEALQAVMLESANEVSNAVAEDLGETIAEFGNIMTQRANALGAVNSNFTNPHGLHDDNHYTTAYDMALIMKESVKHEKFVELISTLSATIPPTERQTEERPLNNSNKMIQKGNTYYYENAVGGKTGFTNEAGNTLVMYGEKDGMELISVVMHANSAASAYNDTRTLLEHGFEQFEEVTVFDAASYSDMINVTDEVDGQTVDLGFIEVIAKENLSLNLPKTFSASKISMESNINYQTQGPVSKDQLLGVLNIKYDNSVLGSVDLYSATDFVVPDRVINSDNSNVSGEESGLFSKIFGIFGKMLIAVVFILTAVAIAARVLRYQRKKQKKARRRAQQMRRGSNQRYRYRDQ